MRIIGGRLRGRRLHSPADDTTRPTSDRAREALFDILSHGAPPVEGCRFLDLFAGSGAVGFEAASRGAEAVVMIENARPAAKLIRRTIEELDLSDIVDCRIMDATRLPRSLEPFDLVFVDPPYGSAGLTPALEGLLNGGWLGPDARVVCETAARQEPTIPEALVLEEIRRYGAACFHFLRLTS